MAFVVPVLAAIGSAMGATAASAAVVGGMTVASGAISAYGAYNQHKAMKKMAEASKPADPVAPPPAQQAARTADRLSMMTGNRAAAAMGGAYAGNSSTFLTGPNGVSTGFSLGRNTLLGE